MSLMANMKPDDTDGCLILRNKSQREMFDPERTKDIRSGPERVTLVGIERDSARSSASQCSKPPGYGGGHLSPSKSGSTVAE